MIGTRTGMAKGHTDHNVGAEVLRPTLSLLLGTALVAGLAVTGCKGGDSGEGCGTDGDCDPGFVCDPEARLCKCTADDVCGMSNYCNSFGMCQARPPCVGNKECDDGQICNGADATGGQCISAEACGSSVHCEFNNYCDPGTQRCVPGCRNTGDCDLGSVCRAGSCQPGNCRACPTSPYPDASYCEHGELCNPGGQCVAHAQKPSFCAPCGAGSPCPGMSMICMVDQETDDGGYCTSGCKTSADCPGGYRCGGTVVPGPACTGTCEGGRVCLGDPEGNQRFCSCVSDLDCALGGAICVDLFGVAKICQNSGLPCEANEDCALACEMVERGDGTTVGQCVTQVGACAKESGVTCENLTQGKAACDDLL